MKALISLSFSKPELKTSYFSKKKDDFIIILSKILM